MKYPEKQLVEKLEILNIYRYLLNIFLSLCERLMTCQASTLPVTQCILGYASAHDSCILSYGCNVNAPVSLMQFLFYLNSVL